MIHDPDVHIQFTVASLHVVPSLVQRRLVLKTRQASDLARAMLRRHVSDSPGVLAVLGRLEM